MPARVSLEHTHIYRVLTGGGEWLARVAGRLRHQAAAPRRLSRRSATGSRSSRRQTPATRGSAPSCRVSAASRAAPPAIATEEQVVAANIDTVFLVAGLDHDFNPRRIERYLLVAWESGATPVIVLNKADLVDDPGRLRRGGPRAGAGVSTSMRCRAATARTLDAAARSISASGGPARCWDRRASASRPSSTA